MDRHRGTRGPAARGGFLAPMTALLLAGATLVLSGVAPLPQAPPPQLGPAPRVVAADLPRSVPRLLQEALPPVDPDNRQSVVGFYDTVYVPALSVPNDWTGSVQGCTAGTTSAAYANATIDMVNYFRAMARLPASVSREPVKDGKAQLAALMMSANMSLSHFPPLTWTCYTALGAEAASKSNLALGAAGAAAVALYIYDPGSNNTAVGHRRWILYPPQIEMGTGSTANGHALWVIGAFGARPTTTDVVAWPPPGFVPSDLVFPRWSFSVNTAAVVSFSGTTVTMTRDGLPVPLVLLANAVGYGDNTLVWEPGVDFGGVSDDETITVQVSNVSVGGVSRTYTYAVTVIDPGLVPAPAFTDTPIVAGGTPIKVIHVTELRRAIDTLRVRYGLAPYSWTGTSLAPGVTVVRALHVAELRTALNEVYEAAEEPPPTYTTPAIVPGTTVITAADINELRAAVLAIW